MVERIEVEVAEPYPVFVGARMDVAGAVSGVLEPAACAILTDSEVGPLYAGSVRQALEASGWRVACVVEVPAGESSKSLEVYAEAVRQLARSGLTRDGTLFALGGGVVGDLGGFVAGTYMRSINFVGLPTSLLAMVDSSIGGKVGVDLPEGKNLVGGFVQPRLVVADLGWLGTLPDRQISCGLAEVVKMGLLSGGKFFESLDLLQTARKGDTNALQTLVSHSLRFKAGVVAEDELERGRRAILNYGHTIGHGLEAAADYSLLHGEAVAAGMVAEATLSSRRFGRDLVDLHRALLSDAGLPTQAPKIPAEAVLSAMGRDKKRRSKDSRDEHRFVLLEDVGEPVWGVQVSELETRGAIEAIVG